MPDWEKSLTSSVIVPSASAGWASGSRTESIAARRSRTACIAQERAARVSACFFTPERAVST